MLNKVRVKKGEMVPETEKDVGKTSKYLKEYLKKLVVTSNKTTDPGLNNPHFRNISPALYSKGINTLKHNLTFVQN